MVLPLLVLAWGCDGPSSDDCPPPASATTGATTRRAAPPKRPFKLPGVMKIDDDTYGLKTDSIVALLTHAFECGARATPLPGAGYRLAVVPPGSPLEQLGLKSGDEVRAIAEVTLASPKSLYRAFRATRDRPFFHLQGRRGGKPLRINYLLADERPSCPPCAQADADPPPPLDEKTKQAILRGIQKQPDGSYRVSSKVLDTVLEHQAVLMHAARIVPAKEGDRVVGLRLAGIQPDSLLAWLGLRDDDQLISVNGYAITDPRKALEAYKQIRSAKQVALKIKRDGKPTTVTYHVGP